MASVGQIRKLEETVFVPLLQLLAEQVLSEFKSKLTQVMTGLTHADCKPDSFDFISASADRVCFMGPGYSSHAGPALMEHP